VDWRKQRIISRVALYYLRRMGYRKEVPVRFDVVALSGTEELDVRLYQNAFDFYI
jgi:putative endonuclease